ncbi:hypothetical protein TRIUR3_19474 [Triticum urartu]|uniref:Uncharacterized protein n=1 Tax=Triticum urartu TaxID=4572 RepID=M7ZJY9_TRIUA|nr:hypothetical protein TRIUR3_19474 [Triticum urartu]
MMKDALKEVDRWFSNAVNLRARILLRSAPPTPSASTSWQEGMDNPVAKILIKSPERTDPAAIDVIRRTLRRLCADIATWSSDAVERVEANVDVTVNGSCHVLLHAKRTREANEQTMDKRLPGLASEQNKTSG